MPSPLDESEYLGCVGEFELSSDAMRAAEDHRPDLMKKMIGIAKGIPAAQVKPESDPYIKQLWWLRPTDNHGAILANRAPAPGHKPNTILIKPAHGSNVIIRQSH